MLLQATFSAICWNSCSRRCTNKNSCGRFGRFFWFGNDTFDFRHLYSLIIYLCCNQNGRELEKMNQNDKQSASAISVKIKPIIIEIVWLTFFFKIYRKLRGFSPLTTGWRSKFIIYHMLVHHENIYLWIDYCFELAVVLMEPETPLKLKLRLLRGGLVCCMCGDVLWKIK